MIIARVVGNIVATQKNADFVGTKILIVQPLTLDGRKWGDELLAVDGVDAGPGDRVLVVQEGWSASHVVQKKQAAIDAAVIHEDELESIRQGIARLLQLLMESGKALGLVHQHHVYFADDLAQFGLVLAHEISVLVHLADIDINDIVFIEQLAAKGGVGLEAIVQENGPDTSSATLHIEPTMGINTRR